MFRGIRILAVLLAFTLSGRAALAAVINIPWVTVGSAAVNSPGRVVLTDSAGGQNGGMWNPCQINLNTSFDMSFDINWGSRACGADGIAFVMQPDSDTKLGGNAGDHAADSMTNCLDVEFDDYSNTVSPYNDPVYDSLGLQTEGNVAALVPTNCGGGDPVSGTCGRPQISATELDIKDGAFHSVEIKWTVAGNTTLTIVVDGSTRAVWTFTPAQINTIFGGNTSVWYGFTAATGGSYNYQQVDQNDATSGNPCTSSWSTPVPPVPAPTALVVPTNDCGTPTDVPTFTFSPTVTTTPTITPTFSQTSTPYPVGCGTPVLVDARNTFNGCSGNSPYTVAYNNPGGANTLLLVRVETGGGGAGNLLPFTSASYGGQPLTFFRSDPTLSGGKLVTYYLTQPPSGNNNIQFTYPGSGCSWSILAVVYSGVDQITPIGAAATLEQPSGPMSFSLSLTTAGPASLIDNLMAMPQLPATITGAGQQQSHNFTAGGNDQVYGDYLEVNGPGTYTMSYTLSQSKDISAQALEIRGAANCNSPTPTPIVSPTDTPTASPTASPTHTPMPTATPTVTRTPTNSRTPTPLPLLLTPHHPNPDPATDTVYLPFTITTDSNISVRVYDVAGELVVAGARKPYLAGNQEWGWDLLNTASQRVSSGVYLCRIEADAAGGQTQVVWEKCSVIH